MDAVATTDAKPEILLPVPQDLEARGNRFVELLEQGFRTHDALIQCELTPEQAGLVLARRPALQKRKESVRSALVEKRKVMVEAVEDRTYRQVMGDQEVLESTETEEGTDEDGNAVSKTKTKRQTRTVSHDNLAIQLLGLDPEHRKVKGGDSGQVANVVAVKVEFHGVDVDALRKGNSSNASATIVTELNKRIPTDSDEPVEDAELVAYPEGKGE